MQVTYEFRPTPPYSLHDMRVERLERVGDDLRLRMRTGLVEVQPPHRQVDGNVRIEQVEPDFSDVCLLSENGAYGVFSGERMEFTDYLRRYGDCPLEILDESYGYNTVTYRGYLSPPDRDDLVEVLVSLYYTGRIVYEVEE